MTEKRSDERQPPRFSGVITHRDRLGRYSIRYPSDWYVQVREEAGEGTQEGITFFPDESDPRTFFNIWIRELEQGIVAEDLEDVREGVQEGLKQLPGIDQEFYDEVVLDNLLKFEIVYTFSEAEQTLKRKIWILYVDRWQYMVTFQGSSPTEYEYWLAMANYSFGTFELPNELWFATDRELLNRYAKELGRETSVADADTAEVSSGAGAGDEVDASRA